MPISSTCQPGKSLWSICTAVFISLAMMLSLSSCQTITRIKCNHKNWTKVGVKDGSAGKLADEMFQEYNNECLASGAEIDKSIYLNGYLQGLGFFCTMENGMVQAQSGFENNKLCATQFGPAFDDGFTQGIAKLCDSSGGQKFGLVGGVYRGTCPADSEKEFLQSYLNALTVALPQFASEVASLEIRSNSLNSEISRLNRQQSSNSRAMKKARKNNNAALADHLAAENSYLSSRDYNLLVEKTEIDKKLATARRKSEDAYEMLLKWKLESDS